ncbi:MAG: LCP family protein, partial [Nitriliruptoraceae bacterium]
MLVVLLALTLLPLAGLAGTVARADAASGRVLTVLLMGSDQGPPRTGDPARGRADGFQLLFVSADRQHATFVSVPRDSWVPVSGRGTTRINSCLTSGPANCVSTVEALWGIDVDGWAVTSMWGFADAVSAFGGLVIDVNFTCAADCGGLPLTSRGLQALNGHEVLTFARNRKQRSGGDFARTRAQAEALAVGQAHLYARGSEAAAAQVASIVGTYAQTSFSAAELGAYALQALRLPPGNVRRIGLPATAGWAGAASVVFLGDGAGAIVADAYADGIVGNPERIGVGARGPDALGPASVSAATSAPAASASSGSTSAATTSRPATTVAAAPVPDPVETAVPDTDLAVATPFVRGPAVTRLQRALAAQGLDVTADGVYGPQTARAVALLQSRTGRRVDGGVGRARRDPRFPEDGGPGAGGGCRRGRFPR